MTSRRDVELRLVETNEEYAAQLHRVWRLRGRFARWLLRRLHSVSGPVKTPLTLRLEAVCWLIYGNRDLARKCWRAA